MNPADYRKAKKGEITCQDCLYSFKPKAYLSSVKNPRLRCYVKRPERDTTNVVSRDMTCRYAIRKKRV